MTETTADTGAAAEPRPLDDAGAERIARLAQSVGEQVATVVEGKREVVDRTLLVLLSGGHLLIEDIPGVGKTVLATSLAAALGAERHRIQFTPDLLPGDITGVSIFDQASRAFEFRPGAVFTQVLLADEINRASPKTQSALLEAMEEHQVSVDGTTYALPDPFFVIATSNPVEMEGTYRLPEAQRDRFTARISIGYPVAEAESRMLLHQTGALPGADRSPVDAIRAVTEPSAVAAAIRDVRRVHVDAQVASYVVRLAEATRSHPQLALGASPRAGVHLLRAAKAHAAVAGSPWTEPEDVRAVIEPVWGHRLHLAPRALSQGATGAGVLAEVLERTPVRA